MILLKLIFTEYLLNAVTQNILYNFHQSGANVKNVKSDSNLNPNFTT